MARTLPTGDPLGYLGLKEQNPPDTWMTDRDPTVDDYRYEVFDEWLNRLTLDLFKMAWREGAVATWVKIGDNSGQLHTLTADTGSATTTAAGEIALTCSNGLETTATDSTMTHRFIPITAGYTGSQREYAQSAIYTTDATVTDLVTVPLAVGEMVSLEARINGFRDNYTEALIARVFTGARRPTAGNVTVINSAIDIFEDSAGAPTVTVIADVGNQELTIQATGEVGKNITWVATYEYSKTLLNT